MVVGGGAGLARYGDALDLGGFAGAVLAGVLQHIYHIPGRVGIHGHVGLLLVVEDHVALAVHHLGVGPGLPVDAAVGEGGVGRGHFPDGEAVGQLAHAEGRQRHVGEADAVDLLPLHQARQAEMLPGKGIALLRGHVRQHLDGDGVQRLGQAVVDQHPAAVFPVFVLGPVLAVELHIGRVLIGGARGDDAHGQAGAVDRQRLDGGARRQLGIRGPVPGQVALLLAHAAGNGHDITGLVVDDHNGGLHLLGGIGLGHVGRIGIDRIHLGLEVQVDGGIDPVAAGGHHLTGHRLGNALLFHQIRDHVPDHHVLKVGVVVFLLHLKLILGLADGADIIVAGGIEFLDGAGIAAGNAGELLIAGHQVLELQLLVAGAFIGLVGEIALLVHLLQDRQGPLLVVFRVDIGIVAGGVVGDADDTGAFLHGQLVQLLAEVDVGRALDAVGALSQIDGIQIPLQDFFLGVVLFKVQGPEDFGDFPADSDVLVLAQVLDQLLGQGGTAEAAAAQEHVGRGAQGPDPVHAVMLPEALVLDGHGGVDDLGGNLVQAHPDPVFHRQKLPKLLKLAGLRVFGIDEGALVQPHAVQAEVGFIPLPDLLQIGNAFIQHPPGGNA